MSNNFWDNIDYTKAMSLYERRFVTHQKLLSFFNDAVNETEQEEKLVCINDYIDLALGIADESGNFSAHRHALGPEILGAREARNKVFALAQQFFECIDYLQIPTIIYGAGIPYLKISVGSEMAMMLNPHLFWVDNIKTMWGYLAKTHDFTYAETQLKDYYLNYKADYKREFSRLRYELWKDEYPKIGPALMRISDDVKDFAMNQGIPDFLIPSNTYLWPDAVVDTAFNQSKWSSQENR